MDLSLKDEMTKGAIDPYISIENRTQARILESPSFDLKKFLKFRLDKWKNKDYWLWQSQHRIDGYEWHHLLGRKYSDLFVVNIPKFDHDRIHSNGYEEGEFEDLFLESIKNIQKYADSITNN